MSDSNSFDPESKEDRKALDGFLEKEELRNLLADNPAVELLYKFTQSLERVPWFSRVGFALSEEDEAEALEYVSGLGLPEVYPAMVGEFSDAVLVAENPEIDSAGWEMEEQLRAALTADALQFMEEDVLNLMMTQIANVAAELIDAAAKEVAAIALEEADEDEDVDEDEAAFEDGEDEGDPEFLKAMVGSGVQACHQAALVLAAGVEDDHPFTAKFRLYELGRWPISISGTSFNVY